MQKTELKLTTGEIINIYDDVYSPNELTNICLFFQNSYYKLGSVSVPFIESKNKTFFQSAYTNNDVQKSGVESSLNYATIVRENFNGMHKESSWVLCSTHLTTYEYHVDSYHTDSMNNSNYKTLLLYGNMRWEKSWGGETFYCNGKGEVEIAIQNKPNRIIVADAHLEHKPAPITLQSEVNYRFTFVSQYRKNV